MTKEERALLRKILHTLECYYPVMNSYPLYDPHAPIEKAAAHNKERQQLLKAAKQLVKKLCRSRIGEHFVV
jgi:hypothetical protein